MIDQNLQTVSIKEKRKRTIWVVVLSFLIVTGAVGWLVGAFAPTSGQPASHGPVPHSAPLEIGVAVPLQVLAADPNYPGLEMLDFDQGVVLSHPPGADLGELDSVDGAVRTPSGEWVIWDAGTAWLFTPSLTRVGIQLGATPSRAPAGYAPALRVVPSPDGSRVWIVEPGITASETDVPTAIHLVELGTGETVLRRDFPESRLPVAATRSALILNSEKLIDTGDGWIVENGSRRVLRLDDQGNETDLGQGMAIEATDEYVVALSCVRFVLCDPSTEGQLVVWRSDGTAEQIVTKPIAGSWLPIGGPMIPSDATALGTASPDGHSFLIGIRSPDRPDQPTLVKVEVDSGTTRLITTPETWPWAATWSKGGEWIAVVYIDGVEFIQAADPERTISARGIVAVDHFPIAGG